MIIPNYDLRDLCIKNQWFTCGSNRQYEKLFYANKMGAPLDEIVTIIWICSDEEKWCRRDIKEILTKAQKEYDAAVAEAEDQMARTTAAGERAADEIYCGYFD